jgi:hypothetical protein
MHLADGSSSLGFFNITIAVIAGATYCVRRGKDLSSKEWDGIFEMSYKVIIIVAIIEFAFLMYVNNHKSNSSDNPNMKRNISTWDEG